MIEININGEVYSYRKAQDSDVSWVYKCLKDFPAGIWASKTRVRDWIDMCDEIDDDILEKDPIPPFKHLMLILNKVSTSQDLGVVIFDHNYSVDLQHTGVFIQYAAIHPDFRGQGNYTVLHDSMVWLCNQYLQADEGYYKISPEAPQVKQKAESKGGKLKILEIHQKDMDTVYLDEVILKLNEVDSVLDENTKKMGKVKNKLGQGVQRKTQKLDKNKP